MAHFEERSTSNKDRSEKPRLPREQDVHIVAWPSLEHDSRVRLQATERELVVVRTQCGEIGGESAR